MGPADLYFNPREEILTVKQTAITIKDHSSVLTFSIDCQSYYISLLFSAIFTAISNFHTIHGYHHLVIISDLIFDYKEESESHSMKIHWICLINKPTNTFASIYPSSFFVPVIMEKLSFLIFKVNIPTCVQIPLSTISCYTSSPLSPGHLKTLLPNQLITISIKKCSCFFHFNSNPLPKTGKEKPFMLYP